MGNRKGLGKKIRFEVFKRDCFTCQYCGKKAPEVVLNVDHIKPVAKGGGNDMLNLITSCEACNAGKSDRELSDNTVIAKQSKQLEELQSRREQLDMLYEWQVGLKKLDDEIIERVESYIIDSFKISSVTDSGRSVLKDFVKKYPLTDIFEAIDISAIRYIKTVDGRKTKESIEYAFNKLSGILHNKSMERSDPFYADALYVSNTINKILYGYDKKAGLLVIRKALSLGFDRIDIIDEARDVRNYADWYRVIKQMVRE